MHENYYQSKEFEELLNKYEVAMQHGDSVYFEPDELTDIAEYYHVHGQTAKGRAVCDYALSIFPGATVFKARAAMVIDDKPDEARRILATANDKTDLEYYYMVAELLLFENKHDEAEAYLEKTYHQIDDDDERADFVLDVATLYADYTLFDQAQHWLSRSDETGEPDYRELKARIAVAKGNIDEAENILNSLIDENPYDGSYWNHLASAQLNGGRTREAINAIDFSIAINPEDQEAIYTKAHALLALNIIFEVGLVVGCCQYSPCLVGFVVDDHSGACLEHFEDALDSFRKAEKLNNTNSDIIQQLYQEQAFALAHLERLDEAEEYIEKALEMATDDDQRQEIMVLHGHILLECGQLENAQRLFLRAIIESHQSPQVYFRIAVSVYDCNYIHLAFKLFNLLFSKVDDSWTEGYSYMALCCYDLDLYDEYLKYLEKACTINPKEASLVLFELFPADLPVKDYVKYARQSIKR